MSSIQLQPHGTRARYMQERRALDTACEECSEANSAYSRKHRGCAKASTRRPRGLTIVPSKHPPTCRTGYCPELAVGGSDLCLACHTMQLAFRTALIDEPKLEEPCLA